MSFFDKRFITNIVAMGFVCGSLLFTDPWSRIILNIGLFALSGAITNWLAIYMLFERVPGIYGSGVIPINFESFKKSIHELIMNQFFNSEILEKYFTDSENLKLIPNFEKLFNRVNFDPVFDSLLEVIETSRFGPMLSMVGGIEALNPLREPFIEKLKLTVKKLSETQQFRDSISEQFSNRHLNEEILKKVNEIVTKRLEELTPDLVKEIIENIIHKHLGWLVVWGGVFGGIIGMITTLLFLKN